MESGSPTRYSSPMADQRRSRYLHPTFKKEASCDASKAGCDEVNGPQLHGQQDEHEQYGGDGEEHLGDGELHGGSLPS